MPPSRKYSRKREAILEAICSTETHPNAEWVYEQVKPQFPDLSLGTVYRNLAMFKAEGNIISVATVFGQERYDGNTKPHPHFICSCCGAVIDVAAEAPGCEIDETLSENTGFEVEYHDLIFHGKCNQCLQKQAG